MLFKLERGIGVLREVLVLLGRWDLGTGITEENR